MRSRPLLYLAFAVPFGALAMLCATSTTPKNAASAALLPLTQSAEVPLGGEVKPLSERNTLPANGTGKSTFGAAKTPVLTSPTPTPTPLPPSQVAPDAIRVGLSTAGKAIEIWSHDGLVLRDLNQPLHVLKTGPGERVQLISGPKFEAKSGTAKFTGPIFVQNGAKISQGWQRVQVQPLGDEPARVTTDGQNARWGHAYWGLFEVFPQQLPEPTKRLGPLALVNVVALEEYLKGVVPWEMSPGAPLEALKAQAICARTKALQFVQSRRFKAGDFDICDYDACQGYPGVANEKPATSRAVEATKGLALFAGSRLIDAVFCTNSGGITAAASDVWKSTSANAYLPSVVDAPPSSPVKTLWQGGMTESKWLDYVSQPWPSFAKPDTGARATLASRRRTSPRTASLYGPDDWPEFYRWKRLITVAQASSAFAAQGVARVASFEVLERSASGRIRRLKVTGFARSLPTLAPMPTPSPAPKPSLLTPPKTPTPAPLVKAPPAILPAPVVPTRSLILDGDAEIRAMFSKRLGSTTALPSSLFVVTPQTDASGRLQGWLLLGAGWGHGVGMCQRGAQNHALEGWDARHILNWYYRGVTVRDLGATRLSWWPRTSGAG